MIMKKKTRLFKYFLTIVKISVLGLPLFALGYHILSNAFKNHDYAVSVGGMNTEPNYSQDILNYGWGDISNACFFTMKDLGLLYAYAPNSDFESYVKEVFGIDVTDYSYSWRSLVVGEDSTLTMLSCSSGLIDEDFLSWTGLDFQIGYTRGAEFVFLNYYINYLINFSIILFIPEVILYFFDFASGLCSKFVDKAVEGD